VRTRRDDDTSEVHAQVLLSALPERAHIPHSG
jgi:hypothetical protein